MEILFISADVAKMLNGKTYGENLYFNPVQDEEGRWFISQEEVNGFFANNPIPEPVEVEEIAAWRVRGALEYLNIDLKLVRAEIDKIEDPATRKIAIQAWEYGNSFDKYSHMIQFIGVRMQVDINQVWAIGKAIKL